MLVIQDRIIRCQQRKIVQPRGGNQEAVRGILVKRARQTVGLPGDLMRDIDRRCDQIVERLRAPTRKRLLEN